MRTTLLPGLLEVARHNLARDAADAAPVRDRPRVLLERRATRCRTSALHLGGAAGRRLRAGDLALAGAAGRLLRRQGRCSAALLDALGVEWRLVDGGPPFLHPGRAAEVLIGAHEAGWLGELHPLVARDFGLGDLEQPPVALELDLDVVLPRRPTRAPLRGPDHLPGRAPGHRGGRRRGGRGADRASTPCAAPAGPELRSVRVFDLYRGEQVGEGSKSLALRLEFRSAERTLTDEEVARACASGSRRRWRARDREGACVSEPRAHARACVGAPASPARCGGRILWASPAGLARGGDRAQRGRAAPGRPLPAPPRAARAGGASTPERLGGGRRRGVRLVSARRRRQVVAELRERGHAGRRPVGRLPARRTVDATSAGTGRTARPSCSPRPCSASPSCTVSEIAGADLVANPGCYSTAAILALAPLARAGLIADAVVDAQERGLGRGPRGDRDARTSSRSTRTSTPTRSRGIATAPEIDQELGLPAST